jgi:hypothetical protein
LQKSLSTSPVENLLSHKFKLQRADDKSCSRTLIWTSHGNENHGGGKFDNDAAWRALELAAKTMHDYNLKRDRYVLGYLNAEEVEITPHNTLDIIFSYKPDIVVYISRQQIWEKVLNGCDLNLLVGVSEAKEMEAIVPHAMIAYSLARRRV